jgi:hypothetical protein
MAKDIFEKNFERGLLTDYKEKITGFLEEFASPKFIGFLTNFALLAASEANGTVNTTSLTNRNSILSTIK